MKEKINMLLVNSDEALRKTELFFRRPGYRELIPYADRTNYSEVASNVMPDRDGEWKHPLVLIHTINSSSQGSLAICEKLRDYIEERIVGEYDLLSVCSVLKDDSLSCLALLRIYLPVKEAFPNGIKGFAASIGDIHDTLNTEIDDDFNPNRLIIPDELRVTHSLSEKLHHKNDLKLQETALQTATEDKPFLNQLSHYTARSLDSLDPRGECLYDLLTKDKKRVNVSSYDDFMTVFRQCMDYAFGVERDTYFNVLRGYSQLSEFNDVMDAYIDRTFLQPGILAREDLKSLNDKLYNALFEMYIIQDLIDDPDITDIKITSPDSIRCRVKGKAYLSNITFLSMDDYIRFIEAVAVRNGIDLSLPQQTFTDLSDPAYRLRFTLISDYVTSEGLPCMAIRKISREKLMDEELFAAGMMDEKIRDFLRDCALYSKGVVFSGAPGSGKTVMLNWYLEQYESSAEVLVIQENDELFTERNGYIFEHVVMNPKEGEIACSLQDLGYMALVSSSNVFVIGEVKGGEILSAVTLANSGCRISLTLHALSAEETVTKMCELIMQGNPNISFVQAKRMLQPFEIIVYLENFSVKEIKQIIGFDEERKEPIFREIYRKEIIV